MRLLSILLLLGPLLIAQYPITGYVLDDATGKPVPFASVFLEAEQSVGVLTNEKGQYRITLTEAQRRGGTLVYTSLSYTPGRADLTTYPLPADTTEATPVNVRLSTQFVELPEVIVRSDIALKGLMRRVLARIPENYGEENYLLRAYHRSYFATNEGFA